LFVFLGAIAVVLLAAAGVAYAAPRPADTVFRNGSVYTSNDAQPTAQAVAVRAGRIVFVGSNAGAAAYVGPRTKVVNLKGRMLMPSFIDSHTHVSYAVSWVYEVGLWGLGSLAAYQDAIREFAAANPELDAIQGGGWDPVLMGGIGPLKQDLDAIDSARPIALYDQDGHALWVNSKALELAGITGTTPNPEGGVIERVPGTVGTPGNPYGEPSGTLRETANDLVWAILPEYTVDQYAEGLLWFQKEVAGPLGITTVFDPGIPAGGPAAKAYERLARAGKLTMRVRAALNIWPTDVLGAWLKDAKAERAKHRTGLFQITAAKFFADGVLEGHTAYLKEDYANEPGFRGEPLWNATKLAYACQSVDAAGFQIHVHCIGDAATDETLDAIEFTRKMNGPRDRRAGITHLEYVDLADIPRFAELGVVAQIQPYWAVKDSYYFDSQLPSLGKWRADHEYPVRSFFKTGALVASSSDWSVTVPPDPLDGIQTGVMRWFEGLSLVDQPLWPAERATRKQMINSFSINGARANFLQGVTGSLAVGKSADLIVLDRNILTCQPEKIGKGKVLLTMFRGQVVYRGKGM
jgi:predicted amidohydrolase YtcJ